MFGNNAKKCLLKKKTKIGWNYSEVQNTNQKKSKIEIILASIERVFLCLTHFLKAAI